MYLTSYEWFHDDQYDISMLGQQSTTNLIHKKSLASFWLWYVTSYN